MSTNKYQQFRELWDTSSMTVREIARHVGISIATAEKWAASMRVKSIISSYRPLGRRKV